jgi:hypothetical protein
MCVPWWLDQNQALIRSVCVCVCVCAGACACVWWVRLTRYIYLWQMLLSSVLKILALNCRKVQASEQRCTEFSNYTFKNVTYYLKNCVRISYHSTHTHTHTHTYTHTTHTHIHTPHRHTHTHHTHTPYTHTYTHTHIHTHTTHTYKHTKPPEWSYKQLDSNTTMVCRSRQMVDSYSPRSVGNMRLVLGIIREQTADLPLRTPEVWWY